MANRAGASWRELARALGVAPNTLIEWWQQHLETGRISSGGPAKRVTGVNRAWLRRRIRDGDFALRALVAELAQRGLKVNTATVANFVEAERLRTRRGMVRRRAKRN